MNDQLPPGPTEGPSLLGVLLQFSQHQVTVSRDIHSTFHQVREDKPLLRFIWRDLHSEEPPDIQEWQVLPFDTTSSPCCAIFALQQHAHNHQDSYPEILLSVQRRFSKDNGLESFSIVPTVMQRVNQLCVLLAEGGFEMRQWASNQPSVVAHLSAEARSSATEQ